MSSPRASVVARLTAGTVLLLAPDLAAAALGAPRAGRHPVLRVLGARQVLQSLVSLHGLGSHGRAVAATTDALHAASCLAMARTRPDLRTPGLRDAALAGTFALWDLTTPRTPTRAAR